MFLAVIIIVIVTTCLTLRIKECYNEDIEIKKCEKLINQAQIASKNLNDF